MEKRIKSGKKAYQESGRECRKYEFSTHDGGVWVRERELIEAGTGKPGRRPACEEREVYAENFREFTFKDREIVETLYSQIEGLYPQTMKRLKEINSRWKGNQWNYEYRVVERFVRCNMGSEDFLSYDIDAGIINLEYVQCPLRGICEDEGVICRPEPMKGILTEKQRKVAEMYALGKTPTEIACVLKNSPSTIKAHLNKIRDILGLKSVRGIIAYISLYGDTL